MTAICIDTTLSDDFIKWNATLWIAPVPTIALVIYGLLLSGEHTPLEFAEDPSGTVLVVDPLGLYNKNNTNTNNILVHFRHMFRRLTVEKGEET